MKIWRIWLLGAAACLAALAADAQLLPEELAKDKEWEEFLATADIIKEGKVTGIRAVTNPWRLTLSKNGVTRDAVWKNPEGRIGGFLEGWKWEIAAYRIDRLLGVGMVPPTIERRFHENRGSLQAWAANKMSYKAVDDKKAAPPDKGYPAVKWNRAVSLQRAFDNLIANDDRHANNILITEDWRMILIDHSRTFGTSSKYAEKLIYHEKRRESDMSVKALPRTVWENLKKLDFEGLKAAVGEYLTDEEIKACLIRRNLQVASFEAKIKELGESQTLY